MNKRNLASLFLIAFICFSCGDDRTENQDWNIPSNEVFDGGPGKDGIPSVDDPQFTSATEISFLTDDELVVGVFHNGIAKAYPHIILDWHEIVNDEIEDLKYALTYCPLTGTAINWNRTINGQETEFGVSGKLYNTNLIPYDRLTDSYWTQIGLECVNGDLIGREIETHQVVETEWGTWKESYPNSLVMNLSTGFSRSYGNYPYGDYITNNDRFLFPVEPLDERLPSKERVLGVIEPNFEKAYSINLFDTERVLVENYDQGEFFVIGSKEDNYILAYENNLGLQDVVFKQSSLPIVAEDAAGNQIGMDGSILSGPMAGAQLNPLNSFIGYWFSLGAFYPEIEIR